LIWVEIGLKDKSQQNAIVDLVLVFVLQVLCFDDQLLSTGGIKMQEEN